MKNTNLNDFLRDCESLRRPPKWVSFLENAFDITVSELLQKDDFRGFQKRFKTFMFSVLFVRKKKRFFMF